VVCCIIDLLTQPSEGAKPTFEITHGMFGLDTDLFGNLNVVERVSEE
jgi:hypothetical protein